MNQPSKQPLKIQLIEGLSIALVSFLLCIPWRMFLESLKKENPQLSMSLFVQLIPFFFVLVVYSVIKSRINKAKK